MQILRKPHFDRHSYGAIISQSLPRNSRGDPAKPSQTPYNCPFLGVESFLAKSVAVYSNVSMRCTYTYECWRKGEKRRVPITLLKGSAGELRVRVVYKRR